MVPSGSAWIGQYLSAISRAHVKKVGYRIELLQGEVEFSSIGEPVPVVASMSRLTAHQITAEKILHDQSSYRTLSSRRI